MVCSKATAFRKEGENNKIKEGRNITFLPLSFYLTPYLS